jgi:hypothetical protein
VIVSTWPTRAPPILTSAFLTSSDAFATSTLMLYVGMNGSPFSAM